MDTCERTRENLSLLACGQLDSKEEAAVREHVAACPACSRYYQSMRGLCAALGALERDAASVEPSAILHETVKKAVLDTAQGDKGRGKGVLAFFQGAFAGVRRSAWAKAAIAACLVVAAAGLYVLSRHDREPSVVDNGGPPVVAAAKVLPSFAVYHRAVSGTSDELDALLDRLAVYRPYADENMNLLGRVKRDAPHENKKEDDHGKANTGNIGRGIRA